MSKLIRSDQFYHYLQRREITISDSEQKALEQHSSKVRELQTKVRRSTAEAILKIGAELSAAQAQLSKHGDGTFGLWCKSRCQISKSTAYRAIAAYAAFKDCPTVGQTFEPTAIYTLSADGAPEEATAEALRQADRGELITAKKAREIVRSYSEPDEDQDQDQDDDDQADVLTWDPMECLRDLHREVARWRRVCPTDQLQGLKGILQDLLKQIDRRIERTEQPIEAQ